MLTWLNDGKEPAWISEVSIPRLLRASPSGAIGKLIRGLINKRSPHDPASDRSIGYRSGAFTTEKHHIFPIKYLPNIDGWVKGDSGDVILNLMLLEAETNKRWINGNPSDHIADAKKVQGETTIINAYRAQYIDTNALAILKNPTKTKKEFEDFLALREATLQSAIRDDFGFEFVGAADVDNENGDNGD